MFAKIFNFKFNGVAEAKVAASFISDAFGKLIVSNNMRSLNISIGKCGSLSIQTKFETSDDLKSFEAKAGEVFRDLKETLVYKEDNFAGVYIFNYEVEAIQAEVSETDCVIFPRVPRPSNSVPVSSADPASGDLTRTAHRGFPFACGSLYHHHGKPHHLAGFVNELIVRTKASDCALYRGEPVICRCQFKVIADNTKTVTGQFAKLRDKLCQLVCSVG